MSRQEVMVSQAKNEEDSWFNDRLFATRTILLNAQIDGDTVRRVIQSMLILEAADAEAPIDLVIGSYGGSDTSGFALYDLLKFMRAPVRTIASGIVGGIAAVVYAAVDREHRYALPNAKFLLHQPSRGSFGAASDLEIAAKELIKTHTKMVTVLSDATGQPSEVVEKDIHRRFWMGVEEAQTYGLVGQVITRRADLS